MLIFGASLDGGYSVRAGYCWLTRDGSMQVGAESWKWVWKLCVPERVRLFIWQCMHNPIPSAAVLARRGIPIDSACRLCSASSESVLQCLRVIVLLFLRYGIVLFF